MKADNIFLADEMNLRRVSPEWSRDELLMQEGIFFLKDISDPLCISRRLLYRKHRELVAAKIDPWEEMGVRKIWKNWLVRMTAFAPFYREHLILAYAAVPEGWTANSVVEQTEGIYPLTKICRLIPFSTHQIRHQSKNQPGSRESMGVWKDEVNKIFLVDLAIFAPWLRRTWQGGFSKEGPKPKKKKRQPTPAKRQAP